MELGAARIAKGPTTRIHQRMRDTHDLWHAATGYKGDVVGELAVLAFTLAQNFGSLDALANASVEQIAAIHSIGDVIAHDML